MCTSRPISGTSAGSNFIVRRRGLRPAKPLPRKPSSQFFRPLLLSADPHPGSESPHCSLNHWDGDNRAQVVWQVIWLVVQADKQVVFAVAFGVKVFDVTPP